MKFKTQDLTLKTKGLNSTEIQDSNLSLQLESFFQSILDDGFKVIRYEVIQVSGTDGIVWAEVE